MESSSDDFRGKDDAHTLMRAAEIHADQGRVKAAMRHLEHARAAMKMGKRRGGKKREGGEREAARE